MRDLRLAVVVLLIACAPAWGASIGLFSTPDYTSNCLDLPEAPSSATFYIVAVGPFVDVCGGVAAAEFRVEGLPAEWLAVSTPTPLANTNLGNPFGAGAAIAFPSGQLGDHILLYTVSLIRVPPTAGAELHVTAHTRPWPDFTCPRVVGGDCPVDPNAACTDGGTLYVNLPENCLVGVSPTTWSKLKGLYE
jgi:hypothetical protein